MISPLGYGTTTNIPTSEQTNLLENNNATRAHSEILSNKNRFFQPKSIIFWLSHGGAAGLAAVPAVLYLGLSEDDFKSGPQRYLFASASFFVNYVQVLTVQQISLNHYLKNLKKLGLAVASGSHGIRQILQIHEGSRLRSRFYAGAKSLFGFLFREGIKWTILIYASMLPPSLAKEVPWLNNEIYKKILRASIIIFLQEAVHERIENFRLPAIMPEDIVQEEIHQFRNVIDSLLKMNQYDGMDNRNEHKEEIDIILQTQDSKKLLTNALNISRSCCNHFNLLSSNLNIYSGALITLLLATVYSSANAGNYSETYSNLADPIEGRIGSIVVDFLFGLYMAIETGQALGYHLRRIKSIFRNHKWELCCLVLTLVVSSCTVGSTLAVANEQNMPRFIKILTVPGTIFDNANFLFLFFYYLIAQCRKNNERVMLASFYRRFRGYLGSLSDPEFLNYIMDASIVEGCDILYNYENYMKKKMPWTQNLSVSEVIGILYQQPRDAAKVISQNGRFGLLRRTEELFASLLTMCLCSLTLIPNSCNTVRIILDYFCPIASIPTGLIPLGLFSLRKRASSIDACEANDESPIVDHEVTYETAENVERASNAVTIKQSSACDISFIVSAAVKSAFVLGLPIAVNYAAHAVSNWVYTHIFHQNHDEAKKASEYTATAVTAICSSLATKSIAVGMR